MKTKTGCGLCTRRYRAPDAVYGEGSRCNLSLRIDMDLRDLLVKQAHEHGTSLAELVRTILNNFRITSGVTKQDPES
jgi:predicted HicB family RNase H-like nuclease